MRTTLLVLIALLCASAICAAATNGKIIRDGTGTCNDDDTCTWSVANGVLTISGSGSMNSYSSTSKAPWADQTFTSVVVADGVQSIGEMAFAEGAAITQVSIADSVSSIGKQAFSGCSSLEKITLGSGFNGSIDENAFKSCTSLTSVTIDGNVTEMSATAFSGCTSLENVTIKSIKSIPNNLFSGFASLKHVVLGSVTSLGQSSFKSCSNLISVSLNEFNGDIGMYAFMDSSLVSLTVDGIIMGIDKSAFYSCSGLTELNFHGFNGPIGDNAFDGCSSLVSVSIDGSVTAIGDNAFSKVENLAISSLETISFRQFYGLDSLKHVVLGNVRSIGDSAFSGSGLIDAKFPRFNGTIGDGAFAYCYFLLSLTIDGIVTSVSGNAFSSCSSLENITIASISQVRQWSPQSLKHLSLGGVRSMDSSVFSNYKNLIDVRFYDFSASISSKAFYQCSGLTSVIIEGSVLGIESEAFYSCTSLTELYFPGFNGALGNSAFGNCKGLVSVDIDGLVTCSDYDFPFVGCSGLENVTISSFEIVHQGFFKSLKNLKYVVLFSVTSLGNQAFKDDYNLLEVKLLRFNGLIGAEAFLGCSNLTSLIIDGHVETIGRSSFQKCTVLKEVSLPGFKGKIEESAFAQCSSLTTLNVDSVNDISDRAFLGCDALERLSFRGFNGSIGDSAFQNCQNLVSLTIDGTVHSIGNESFSGCNKLTDLNVQGVKIIESGAFTSCFGLTSFTFGEPLEYIGESAFYECTGLSKIIIPSSVVKIEDSAFESCSSLSVVVYKGRTDPGPYSSDVFKRTEVNRVLVPSNYKSKLFCGKKVKKIAAVVSSAPSVNNMVFSVVASAMLMLLLLA